MNEKEMKCNARIHIGAVVEKLRMDGCELWEIDEIVSDILNYITIPEGSVVLTKEAYKLLINDFDKSDYGDFENGYRQGFKDARNEVLSLITKL